MGDGIVRKFALVIAGNSDPAFLEDAAQGLTVLKSEGYETFFASPQPADAADHYASASVQHVEDFAKYIGKNIDDDDELVIYAVAHGDMEDGRAQLCLPDGCNSDEISKALDIAGYGKRTVILNSCFSGNWNSVFMDDPRTLFISSGSSGELVSGMQFSQYFWAGDVPDMNNDGVVSFQERYEHAISHVTLSNPQFVASAGYVLEGAHPFSPGVETIGGSDAAETFNHEMAQLRPGQYAVVFFSEEGAPASEEYAVRFSESAERGEGQHLYLQVKSEDVASAFGIREYPTVMIFDYRGRGYAVSDIEDVSGELARFELPMEQRIANLRVALADPDPVVRATAMVWYSGFASARGVTPMSDLLQQLEEFMAEPDPLIMDYVAHAYQFLAPAMSSEQKYSHLNMLAELVDDNDPVIRAGAVMAYRIISTTLSTSEIEERIRVMEGWFNDSSEPVRYEVAKSFRVLAGILMQEEMWAHHEVATGHATVEEVQDDLIVEELISRIDADDDSIRGIFDDVLSGRAGDLAELRDLLFHEDANVRHAALYLYMCMVHNIGSAAASAEATALREIWTGHDVDIRRRSVELYGDLAERLDARRISRAEEVFDPADNLALATRWSAVTAYITLFELGLVRGSRLNEEIDVMRRCLDGFEIDLGLDIDTQIAAGFALLKLNVPLTGVSQ
jgi:hypothetical protein